MHPLGLGGANSVGGCKVSDMLVLQKRVAYFGDVHVYDDMVLTATCWLDDPTRIPEIAGWLKGAGKVTFATRPGGWYEARIANQISFERILRGNPHRSFAVNFRCKPFWHGNNTETIELTTSGSFVNNPGGICAEPIITVYGNGDICAGLNRIQLPSFKNKRRFFCCLCGNFNSSSRQMRSTRLWLILRPSFRSMCVTMR